MDWMWFVWGGGWKVLVVPGWSEVEECEYYLRT